MFYFQWCLQISVIPVVMAHVVYLGIRLGITVSSTCLHTDIYYLQNRHKLYYAL